MVQKISVPEIKKEQGGVSELRGEFDVGEGNYHVDWLMRDRDERICATSWNLQTHLNVKDSRFRQWVPQALSRPIAPLFSEEVLGSGEHRNDSLNIAIIARFDPRHQSSPEVDKKDLEGVVAILRQVLRDPRVGTFSLVACSSEAEQTVYRQEDLQQIDLQAFGRALGSLRLGTMDARRIPSANGAAEFIADVIDEQMRKEAPDAVIIISHTLFWESGRPHEIATSSKIPIFHLEYDSGTGPQFRDPISSIVKRLRGTEYAISRPSDIFDAWSDIVSRIQRSKQILQPAPRGGSGGL
jgi:hypothetical protein